MGDFGISATLPKLSADKVQAVIKRLESLGVPDEVSLQEVEIENLMEDGLLKKLAARKLVDEWKKGENAASGKAPAGNGGKTYFKAQNIGRAEVTEGDHNENHYGMEFMNFGEVKGDILHGGGAKKVEAKTNYNKAKINVKNAIHSGTGNITEHDAGSGENAIGENNGPIKIVVQTDYGEAEIQAENIHSGVGDIISKKTSESVVPKGFYFEDAPDLFDFKKLKTKKGPKNANLEKIIDEWRYPVKCFGRNQALILNNWEFKDSRCNRQGADMDTNHLVELLTDLGFMVTKKENLTKAGIIEEVKKFTLSPKMGQASISLLFIGSHGAQQNNKDQFMDYDTEMVPVDEIIDLFNPKNAPSLFNIPKIFLFQFCRVLEEEEAIEDVASDDATKLEWFDKQIPTPSDNHEIQKAHLLADMFIGCATVPGSAAFRSTLNGSWFVTTLLKVFKQKAYEEDMATLFMKINDSVMNKKGNTEEKVQMCVYTSSLRKKIYFYPQDI